MAAPVWKNITYAAYSVLSGAKMGWHQDNHRAVAHGKITGASDTGAADAYVLTGISGLDALISGLELWFLPANTNTGPSTLNVNSLGAKQIFRADGNAPYPGDIKDDYVCHVVYNATLDIWQLHVPADKLRPATGYICGGYDGATTYYDYIDGLQFCDESSVNPSAVLKGSARMQAAGVNSATRGYLCGGSGGAAAQAEIQGLHFPDETSILLTITLADGARYGAAGINSAKKGYACGGYDTTYRAYIDGLQYSDETAVNPSAVLADGARYIAAGVGSTIKGYICGGYDTTYSAYIDGLQYSDETAVNPSAVLADGGRRSLAGITSTARGYACGGYNTTYRAYIDGLQYSDETAVNPSAVLADGARAYADGFQSGGIL